MKIEETKLRQIEALCKNNKVKSLFAFGSVLRSDFNDASDIDLIVDFDEKDPIKYTDLYFSLKDKLEAILTRQVDLLEERAIKNKFFKQELDNTKVKIYGY
jgi:predicted nucleotidyltransferase